MLKNYEYRFSLKPGKYVYLPTDEAREKGTAISVRVLRCWSPPNHFFHLGRKRGHLAAAKMHLNQKWFGKRDIKSFFNQVTRTKISRALNGIGFSAREAFEIAHDSVVYDRDSGNRHLPYGFVQSPTLATLVLDKSALGRALEQCPPEITVTVFMDDILYSANSEKHVLDFGNLLDEAARNARLNFSKTKNIDSAKTMRAFNCVIEHMNFVVSDERINRFTEQLATPNPAARESILRYVNEINQTQATQLSQI